MIARTRLLRGAVVVLAVLGLAGCSAIPTSGPVSVQTAKAADDPGELVFVPNPPANGATPQEIVSGFVLAAIASDGYGVARQFLTEQAAAAWDPATGVLVHDQPLASTRNRAGTRVELTVRTSARLDAHGEYVPSTQERRLPFRLQQVGGQWRIASAPDGIVLSQVQFQRVFRPEKLQFFDPTWRRLVPDLRWLPARSDTPAGVVRTLLAGRAGPIGPGVAVSAFPDGTELASPVRTSGSAISVAVDVPGADPDATSRARMQQQLTRTFAPSAVDLVVNGRSVPRSRPPLLSQPEIRPVGYTEDRFGLITGQGVSEDALLGRRIAALRPRAVTVSDDQKLAVVLDSAGRAVVVQPNGQRVVDTRAPLVDPSLDKRGWTWTVPVDDPTGLRAISAKGVRAPVAPRLGGVQVSSIEVSPDGTRLLVLVVQPGSAPDAFVAGIERSTDGTPTGLTIDRYPVVLNAERAIDATWVDDDTVAVLTSDSEGQNQSVSVQPLGGVPTTLGRLSNATALVGTSEQADLRAVLQNGDLVQWASGGWQPVPGVTTKVGALAVQR